MSETVNIMPDWETLLNAQIRGDFNNLEIFRPLCKLGDILRKCQKEGKRQLIVKFTKDGRTIIDDGE